MPLRKCMRSKLAQLFIFSFSISFVCLPNLFIYFKLQISATEVIQAKLSTIPTKFKIQVFGYDVPTWITNAYRQIGVFAFGAAVQQLTTDIAKYSIGRFRPHFINVSSCFIQNFLFALIQLALYYDILLVVESWCGKIAIFFVMHFFPASFLRNLPFWFGQNIKGVHFLARHIFTISESVKIYVFCHVDAF